MRILIVDNEKQAVNLLKIGVESFAKHADIITFSNGKEAWDWADSHSCDIVFLDTELGDVNGIDLAKHIKEKNVNVNLIFVTSHPEYAVTAHSLRASGYLLKPVTVKDLKTELDNLRFPVGSKDTKDALVIKCFGNFEVFYHQRPLQFKRSKTKELLAVLVDRNGASVTSGEICAKLWEMSKPEQKQKDYFRHLVMDLKNTLKEIGKTDILVQKHNSYSIVTDRVICDYYDYLDGNPDAIRVFQGEYMYQYSWAEGRMIGTI